MPGGPSVTVDVSVPGDTATLTFDGTVGQRLSLDVTDVTIGTSTCCSTKVSPLRPDGKALVGLTLGTNGGFIDSQTLPQTGTYSILVDAQKATDAAGNTDAAPALHMWTVDTSTPDTIIDAGPTDPTSDPDAAFSFSSTESGSTFECSLDGSPFASCASPEAYTGLAAGSHLFEVRAVDLGGNVDPTPATYGWTVA